MLHVRHIVALVVMFVALIGVLTISFFDVLDIDRMLVEVSECKDSCIMAIGNRCVRCADLKHESSHRHRRAGESVHYHPKDLGRKDPYRTYGNQDDKPQHQHNVPQTQDDIQYPLDDNHHYQHHVDSNGCSMLTACLMQCPSGLENICTDKVDRNDHTSSPSSSVHLMSEKEPLCEDDRPAAMGHAGGDPINACENTVEATISGIRSGMSAVHLDISVSADLVPFLWRDHDPRSLTARLRQMGSYGVMGCRPALAPETVKPAHLMSWETIESAWFYVNTTAGLPVDHEVITFQEWLEEVAHHLRRLDKIWLEFRVPKELLHSTILIVWELSKAAGIKNKLFFNVNEQEEIKFPHGVTLIGGVETSVDKLSDHQWNALINFLEEVQTADKDDDVFILNREDEVVYALMVEKLSAKPSLLSQELKALVDTSHLNLRGINFEVKALSRLVGNTEQIIISRDKITRDNCNPQYTQVIVWTVNSAAMMKRMVCLHVDYIITDYPGRMARNPHCDLKEYESYDLDCPTFCARQYAPVCGSDGKTYSNSCMMKFHSCEQGLKVKLVSDGRCPSDKKEKTSDAMRDAKMDDISPEQQQLDPELEERASAFGLGFRPEDSDKNQIERPEVKDFEIETDLLCNNLFCIGKQGYVPVCGVDGKTYDSDCHLRKSRCNGKAIAKAHNGACNSNPCRDTCCNIENPVCGSDRVSYMNQCLLVRTACFDREDGVDLHMWHRGHCKQCTFICTREFRPVCGSDGKTYANQCTMEQQTCEENTPVWFVHEGECRMPGPLSYEDHQVSERASGSTNEKVYSSANQEAHSPANEGAPDPTNMDPYDYMDIHPVEIDLDHQNYLFYNNNEFTNSSL